MASSRDAHPKDSRVGTAVGERSAVAWARTLFGYVVRRLDPRHNPRISGLVRQNPSKKVWVGEEVE
jgi:hypothetical protein